jgi:hypothetical protein
MSQPDLCTFLHCFDELPLLSSTGKVRVVACGRLAQAVGFPELQMLTFWNNGDEHDLCSRNNATLQKPIYRL